MSPRRQTTENGSETSITQKSRVSLGLIIGLLSVVAMGISAGVAVAHRGDSTVAGQAQQKADQAKQGVVENRATITKNGESIKENADSIRELERTFGEIRQSLGRIEGKLEPRRPHGG